MKSEEIAKGCIRLTIISHSYVLGVNHRKIEALSKYKDLRVQLIVPRSWHFALRSSQLERRTATDYLIKPLPTYLATKGSSRNSLYFYAPISLLRAIRDFETDILYVEEEPWSLSLFQIVLTARLCRRPKVVFFTWENIYKRWSGVKHIYNLIERYNLRNSDYSIAGNRAAKEVLRRKGFSRSIDVVAQFGVDPELFKESDQDSLRKKLGLKGFIVGYVGRLVKEKGILTLLEAIRNVEEELSLLVVGGGPLLNELSARVKSFPQNKHCFFIDTLKSEDLISYLNCLDVLVLPSISTPGWKEQFGHVLIEAMSCGIPVVGSDSGAIPEVIAEAGLTFKEGDAPDLKRKLELLLNDIVLRDTLSLKGRTRVLSEFTHEVVAGKLHKAFRSF